MLLSTTSLVSAGTITFAHHPSGRLTSANFGDGKSVSYTYDNAGSLTLRQFLIGVAGDSDNDGMDDAWELQYFGTLARDGSGDFDSDGLTDFAEWLAGTHPTLATSALRIIRITAVTGISATVEWSSVPGKQYRVQYKDGPSDLVWLDLPGETTATGDTASATDGSIGGSLQRFYRVTLATGAASPVLSVALSGGQALIRWPSSTPAGFTLETATNLNPGALWSPLTNQVSNDGTTKAVLFDINPVEPVRVFRLSQ